MGIDLGRFKSNKNNDEWLEWLSDDPVPASIRTRIRQRAVRQVAQAPARRPIRRSSATETTSSAAPQTIQKSPGVSIHIALPSMRRPRLRVPRVVKKNAKPLTVVAILLFFVAGGALALKNTSKDDISQSGSDTKAVLSQNQVKPDFTYILPKGKSAGADMAVKFDPEKKVVNFQDSIGGVPITISQQQLPTSLKEDTQNRVKKLAEEFAATEVLSTANPTAYLGTSAKGPQTIIFAKKDLLIFIQSSKEIDNHDWAEYVTNLQ